MLKAIRVTFRFMVIIALTCAIFGAFGVNATTINFLPDLDINPKMVIAIGAVITAACFSLSDSKPIKPLPGGGRGDSGWRDTLKLLTHGFAIVTAGWAVWFTSQGWM